MTPRRLTARLAGALAVVAAVTPLAAQTTAPLPRTHRPTPTVAAITASDLMTRLYRYADDSMMGREAGTLGNVKATDYIAGEVKRLGLKPAGDSGGYFQTIEMMEQRLDSASRLAVGGVPLAIGTDVVVLPALGRAFPFGQEFQAEDAGVVYGGRIGDSTAMIPPEQTAGKAVVFSLPEATPNAPSWQFWSRGGLDRYSEARAIVIAGLDSMPADLLGFFRQPRQTLGAPKAAASGPLGLLVDSAAAQQLLGTPLAAAQVGAAGASLSGSVRFAVKPVPYPARNVVAILPGRDPALSGEYVAVGAHNDHIGMSPTALDHDSVRVFNRYVRPRGANDRNNVATPAQLDSIQAELDSIRKLRPIRRDSIFNGADDDGSGTVSVLEIAQYMASLKGKARPRRSILFVWHTGEEKGLYGSQWFTDHPTVPRDSIVAQLNIDMLGRGRAEDTPGGGPRYIDAIGSRRLSTELGDIVDSVNAHEAEPMNIDYSFDAPGHPMNRYCRSDHYMYARYGIPIVFFSTAYSVDYHQVTDEPQYIDYDHMARNARFIRDVLVAVADADHRPVVDHPKPDPNGGCRQ